MINWEGYFQMWVHFKKSTQVANLRNDYPARKD